MKAHVEKKVDVTIELETKERNLLYDAFNLLEKIDEILTDNELFDDDYFDISCKDGINGYSSIKKQVYELDELRSNFDRFLED